MDEDCTTIWNDSFFINNESKGLITDHEILEGPMSIPLKCIGKR